MNESRASRFQHRPDINILAVILAGGKSTRMQGREKTLLSLGGMPLIEHVIKRLERQIRQIAVNANGDKKRFAHLKLPIFADISDGYLGPLAGILASLHWGEARGYSHIVTVAGDTPFFPSDLVIRLSTEMHKQKAEIALAATVNLEKRLLRHPTFGIWDTSLGRDLQSALNEGVRKVTHWADQRETITVEFDAGPPDPFFNINRPADLSVAASIQSQFVS